MTEKGFKITFEPEGKTVFVPGGETIFDAIGKAGIIIIAECGGAGVCGGCKVKIMEGDYEQRCSEGLLSEDEVRGGTVLACRTGIKSDMVIEIPSSSRLFEQRILTDGTEKELRVSPNIRKVFLEVEKPTLEDRRSDLDRIRERIGHICPDSGITIDALRTLPDRLREGDFSITVVFDEDEIIAIETGDGSDRNYGLAFDIGTTTVVGYLLDLNTGRQLAVASRINPQTGYGDDVVSRINYGNTNKDGLKHLHEKIISCMNDIVGELTNEAGVEKNFIYEITTAGNTTMNHLFLRINPRYIALNPYVGVIRSDINTRARELDIDINKYGKVYSMPNIAGFVGGDTVALILSSGMHKGGDLRLAIDIGTNGELVMGSKERLIACSTAAGPAFEGARLAHGMKAGNGAIERVLINEDGIEISTIGNSRPIGLCGSGIIDSIAELLKAGVIEKNGRLLKREEIPSHIPDFIKERLILHERFGVSFVLVPGSESKTGQDIILSRGDVREIQLAKSAIYAGYRILKSILNVTDNDIMEVLVAGAFGNYIRREQARYIGLIPDIPTGKIRFIGNAAGSGAKMVLLAREFREEAREISKNTEYIELAAMPEFQGIFMDSMSFPSRKGV